MNRKKGLVITLALAFVLLCSSVAYAWDITYNYCVINYNSSQIQGYVVTGCDVYADSITERGWLYMDGDFVKGNSRSDYGTTYSQCPVYYNNPSGEQGWYLSGRHSATYGGTTKGPYLSNSSLYGV